MSKLLRIDSPQTADRFALSAAGRAVGEVLRCVGAVFAACIFFYVAFVL
jgi:hypothetical protein